MKKRNTPVETTKREEENVIYRRFKLVSPDKERALLALMKAKGLKQNDILQTVALNKQCSDTSLILFFKEDQVKKIESAVKSGLPVLISGRQGATGKTSLANYLRSCGITAFEQWELCVQKKKNDENSAYVLIVLDELISGV